MPDREEWMQVTIPIRAIVARLGWWLLVVGLLVFAPLVLRWGTTRPPASWVLSAVSLRQTAVGVAVLLVAYIASVPIHEGLHALGMVMTGSRPADITFGARLLHGVVYVHCRASMRLSAYRIVLILPVAITGLVPAAWGLVSGNVWVSAYAYLMIVSAVGDLEMYWRLRAWPGDALVRDHPSMLGCEIKASRSEDGVRAHDE